MLALIVAQPGPVNDGLVALLEAAPQVRKIAHVRTAKDAWDFVNTICPDIAVIHTTSLLPDLAAFITDYKDRCRSPLLAIVLNEEDRQLAEAHGADIAVMEGLPSSKLSLHLASLMQENSLRNL